MPKVFWGSFLPHQKPIAVSMYWPLCALPGPPQSSPARPRFSEDLNRRRTAYCLPLTGYGFTLNFRQFERAPRVAQLSLLRGCGLTSVQ
eukprot:scaffold61921_cov69-Phaeocystis_antarctica.AAC.6